MTQPVTQRNVRRIFVDVSETLGLDVRTGIQRVVRQLCRTDTAFGGEYAIIPVVAIAGQLLRLSPRGEQQLHAPPANTYVPAAPYKTPLPLRILRVILSPFPATLRKVRRRRAAKLFDRRLREFAAGPPIMAGAGDRVVLADTYGHSTILAAGIRARKKGSALIALTYDLFPITHSYLMDEESVANFIATVPPGMEASDGVLTISNWCVSELRRFGVTKPVGRFYLGYDIPVTTGQGHDKDASSDWPEHLWVGGRPVFLMVGTIATSKGHPIALAAFEKLWSEGVNCALLMVGRPGWEVDTLIRQLNEHPENGRRLFLVHGANDDRVQEAFRKADAAIIGSVVEGFGLPLVEALACSLPVIASDIEIFREIAGDTVLRYEQNNPDALAAAVKVLLEDQETYVQKARDFSWLDWDGARAAFADEVNRLAEQAGK